MQPKRAEGRGSIEKLALENPLFSLEAKRKCLGENAKGRDKREQRSKRCKKMRKKVRKREWRGGGGMLLRVDRRESGEMLEPEKKGKRRSSFESLETWLFFGKSMRGARKISTKK